MTRAKYLTRDDLRAAAKIPNFGRRGPFDFIPDPPYGAEFADPRARYLRLLQAWVECRPHQPVKRRIIEGALARARASAIKEPRP
jgi:hypothetical protein